MDRKRIDVPTLDTDNKSVVQVMIPDYTQSVTDTTVECKSKLFRIKADAGGCTIKFLINGVETQGDLGIGLNEGDVEYFGAKDGDVLSISGIALITWSR